MPLTKDTSVWEKMKKNLRQGNNLEVRVGWFPEAQYGPENDNLQVAQVAQWNEEGTETNPVRPFIRVGFMKPIQKGMYDRLFFESIQRIAEGKTTFAKEYQKIGKMAVVDLKEVIEDWSSPPNSPVTIERKGFNNPLIDTGTMYDTVDYKIDKRGNN